MKQSILTQRLVMRPIGVQDSEFIYQQMNSPNWIKYIGDRDIIDVAAAKKYIQKKILPQFAKLGFSNYLMILRSTQEPIGSVGLFDRPGLEGVDIGFALFPNFEKQGFGYEAAAKILELGFKDFGLTTVNSITTHDNIASQYLIKKLGLSYIREVNLPDDPQTLMLFQITSEQYFKHPA